VHSQLLADLGGKPSPLASCPKWSWPILLTPDTMENANKPIWLQNFNSFEVKTRNGGRWINCNLSKFAAVVKSWCDATVCFALKVWLYTQSQYATLLFKYYATFTAKYDHCRWGSSQSGVPSINPHHCPFPNRNGQQTWKYTIHFWFCGWHCFLKMQNGSCNGITLLHQNVHNAVHSLRPL